MRAADRDQLVGVRGLRRQGHRHHAAAGEQLLEQLRVAGQQRGRVLRAAAGRGEERALQVHPGQLTRGDQRPEQVQPPVQVLGRCGHQAGDQRRRPVAVVVPGGGADGGQVVVREAAAGAAVAVQVDQAGQQQPVGGGRRQVTGEAGRRTGVGDPVVDDGDHAVVDDRPAGDQPAAQDGQDVVLPSASSPALVAVTVAGVAAGAAASSVLATTASASSSRPGVLRFHLRITKRNST